jgi:hypothetical protein
MTVTLSQDIQKNPTITQVLSGAAVRTAKSVQDAVDKPSGQTPNGKGITSSGEVLALLDAQREESVDAQAKSTFYDEPDGRTQKALDIYQSLAVQQKREQLQQLLSVDLYA